MIFNSWTFAIFFAVVYLVYLRIGHQKQNLWLWLMSYLFYGFWDYRFLGLIAISTLLDYSIGIALDTAKDLKAKKLLITLSVMANLAFLGFFKYYDFFIKSLSHLLNDFGIQVSLPFLGIAVPVGISFYTFQSLSYTIDVYRGHLKACRKFSDYALFVSFFPQLVAGPIERAGALIFKVQNPRILTAENLASGFWLVLKGYFLKVFVADNLFTVVDEHFLLQAPTGAESVLGVLAFTIQIYCDFSGYSNIARGLSRLLGFDLMVNFKVPYLSRSPSEFWKRWHISLSSWLRDYLYIPLGGNRNGLFRTYFALMATMLLGGLWHGAEWKYVIWGGYHGLLLVGFKALGPTQFGSSIRRLPRFIQTIGYFILTCYGWLIFRCENLSQLYLMPLSIFKNFSANESSVHTAMVILFLTTPVVLLDCIEEWVSGPNHFPEWGKLPRILAYSLLGGLIFIFGSRGGAQFIYFQF